MFELGFYLKQGIIAVGLFLASIFSFGQEASQVIPPQDITPYEAPSIEVGAYPFGEQVKEVYEEKGILGANQINFVGGKPYFLAGSGISSTDTTITLTSFTMPVTDIPFTMADFGSILYGTIEPTNSSRKEFVSCTGVTQAANSATLTGCSRGLQFTTPYTASTTLAQSHAGSSRFVISNPPQLYNEAGFKGNNETITGYWNFPSPISGSNPATRDYVLSVVTGGTITTESVIVSGTAGESMATGTVVYLKTSDARWYKADSDDTSHTIDAMVGIAQGTGVTGNNIQSGVMVKGLDSTQTGLTIGANYFVSGTAGNLTTSTTTKAIGKARTATTLYVDPYFVNPRIFSYPITVATTTATGLSNIASTTIYATTTSGTWTKPANLRYLIVEVMGGGGGGGGAQTNASGGGMGGGGGGYSKKVIPTAALGATETVTIGGGGAGNTNAAGDTGGTTSFGTHLQATGGVGGGTAVAGQVAGAGGVGTLGDFNTNGPVGNMGVVGASNQGFAGSGASSMWGGGGSGRSTDGAGTAATGFGSGGGGSYCDASCTQNAGGAGSPGVVRFQYVFF